MVKNPSASAGDPVQSLGWEDPLEKGMAIHSSILAWEIQWTEDPCRSSFMGSHRVRHDWATNTFTFTFQGIIKTGRGTLFFISSYIHTHCSVTWQYLPLWLWVPLWLEMATGGDRSNRAPVTVKGLCVSTSSLKALSLQWILHAYPRMSHTQHRAMLSQLQSLQPKPPWVAAN